MAFIETTSLLHKVFSMVLAVLTLNGVTYGTNHINVHIKKRKTVSNKQVA